ncbi:hypothetical protein [Streptomyces sp. NBC_01235]|uniref:hypothetical protein n=1 Tax=Streptomyces sp. NBC_01235 TaxID=2903788 RepID=UPI003FA3C74F
MYETGPTAWLRFELFLAAGLVLYVFSGRRDSRLAGVTPGRAGPADVTPDADATAAEPRPA